MNAQPPVPAASNTFERIKRIKRIKRVSAEGHESWSARDLARVLEYSVFRSFAEKNPLAMGIPKALLEDSSDAAKKKVSRMRRNYGIEVFAARYR